MTAHTDLADFCDYSLAMWEITVAGGRFPCCLSILPGAGAEKRKLSEKGANSRAEVVS
jgi:hypothetical protein